MNHPKQFQGSLHSLTLYVKQPSSSIFSTTRDGSRMGGLEVILHSICRSLDRDFWLDCQQRLGASAEFGSRGIYGVFFQGSGCIVFQGFVSGMF